jgi:FPC/CPF motif-containing protein YcgG
MAQEERAAEESTQYRFQYAVRFLCTSNIPGTSQTNSVHPGSYQTVVSIHNPHDQRIQLRQKIAAFSRVSKFIDKRLEPYRNRDVNCKNIARDFGIAFVDGAEGFLVIESTHSLDVTAIYTAGEPGEEVESMSVMQVKERRLWE